MLISIYFLTRFGKLIHVPIQPCPLLLQSQLWVPLVALGRHILQLSFGKCSICEQFRRNSKQKRCAAANVYFIYNCTTSIFFSTCTFSWLFLFRRADFSDFFFGLWIAHIKLCLLMSSHFEQILWAFQLICRTIFIHG